MSYKAHCPACKTYTSAVWQGFADGTGCPVCGLPTEAFNAVESARDSHANADLIAKYGAAVIRAGKAEAELAKATEQLRQIRAILEGEPT